MRRLLCAVAVVLMMTGVASAKVCPDGSYVGGDKCKQCPDGTWVGGDRCYMQPDGTYTGKR